MALVLGFTFAGAQTVYFVNAPGWSEVKIHMWGGNGTTWPGLSMTKTSDKILDDGTIFGTRNQFVQIGFARDG